MCLNIVPLPVDRFGLKVDTDLQFRSKDHIPNFIDLARCVFEFWCSHAHGQTQTDTDAHNSKKRSFVSYIREVSNFEIHQNLDVKFFDV
jgi:hypothetical protein